ncbi:LacI family DNA-binding transcriptional regulator [Rhizobium sp. 18055]|uniref:LacI family DNA-binding transcriptional regulator n=1 Tax=Rhizobium sp. 18055 TaxID=2681403 RepID=UPI001357E194|nr:LacI family DNA-binding transcriptional regulator [Rhizobium sp. 18055]
MRPTIEDLAQVAGVSRATVNRVIGRPHKVKAATRQLVVDAAAEIGYHGFSTLKMNVQGNKKPFRLTLLLQAPNPWFVEQMSKTLRVARDQIEHRRKIILKTERLIDFSPEALAERLLALGRKSDAVALVAAEHPIVTRAIEQLAQERIPVYALVTTLSAPSLAGYIGLNGRKFGRTAAWALDRLCGHPEKLGILVGSPRYREHELAESGFRSYFLDHDQAVQVLDALPTYESEGIAREMTERLLSQNPDMNGLFLAGGGTSGVLSALRDSGRANEIATIAIDLTEESRAALLDGTLDIVIAHPFPDIGQSALELIISKADGDPFQGRTMTYVNLNLITAENVE